MNGLYRFVQGMQHVDRLAVTGSVPPPDGASTSKKLAEHIRAVRVWTTT
jgi:hypothetical protein